MLQISGQFFSLLLLLQALFLVDPSKSPQFESPFCLSVEFQRRMTSISYIFKLWLPAGDQTTIESIKQDLRSLLQLSSADFSLVLLEEAATVDSPPHEIPLLGSSTLADYHLTPHSVVYATGGEDLVDLQHQESARSRGSLEHFEHLEHDSLPSSPS